VGSAGTDVPEPFEQILEVWVDRIEFNRRQTEPFVPLPACLAILVRGVEPDVLGYVLGEDWPEFEKKAASSPSA
jgi:hypothetical protein